MTASSNETRLGIVLLTCVSVGWGMNWPAMKTALTYIPIWQFRGVSLVLAGLLLLVIARVARMQLRVPRRQVPVLLVAAAFNITGWHMLVAFGVRIMASGQASVLAFTMPVWASILGAIFLGERLTPRRLVALVLGSGAIAVLLFGAGAEMGADPAGALLMTGAAISWAIGTIIQKAVAWEVRSVPLAGWQILAGSLPILGIAFATEPFEMFGAPIEAQLSTLYLILIPLSFCYYGWFRVVTIFPAMIAGLGTLMVPVLGLLGGAAILGEPLGWPQFTALFCVVTALLLVFTEPSRLPRVEAQPQ